MRPHESDNSVAIFQHVFIAQKNVLHSGSVQRKRSEILSRRFLKSREDVNIGLPGMKIGMRKEKPKKEEEKGKKGNLHSL